MTNADSEGVSGSSHRKALIGDRLSSMIMASPRNGRFESKKYSEKSLDKIYENARSDIEV
jgi:hypothetical protein